MIGRDPVDRELTAWIAEQDSSHPGYLDDVLAVTRQTSQRPAWSFPGRWIPMQLTLERVRFPRATKFVVLLAILALALALTAVALVGSRRQVAPPPFGPAANGDLAYGTQSGDIVSVDPATADTTVLVGGPELDSQPVYSRDGSRLAFVRAVEGGFAVFAVDRAGGPVAQLTTSRHLQAGSLAWSPDGARIAFEDDGKIWVTSTDGRGTEIELPLGQASAAFGPVWRPPSGEEILFKGCEGALTECESESAGSRLFLTAADGSGQPTAVSSADTWANAWDFVAFDPTGSRIVTQRLWDGMEGVTVLTLDPGSRRVVEERRALNGPEDTVVDGVEPSGPFKFGPRLSPDGTRVAVLTYLADGGDRFRVGVGSIDDPHSLVMTGPEFVGMGWTLEWSPDGASLLVMHESGRWILDPDGGPAIQKPWTEVVGDGPTWQRIAP